MNSVNWADFFAVTFVVLAVYYVVVVFLLFRRQGSSLFNGAVLMNYSRPDVVNHPASGDDQDARMFSAVHDLLEDLKSFWKNCVADKPGRAELLAALRTTVARYPQLKQTAFAVAINNQILLEADQHCGVLLDENELNSLWMV